MYLQVKLSHVLAPVGLRPPSAHTAPTRPQPSHSDWSEEWGEGRPAARLGDQTLHCGMAPGTITTGAGSVLIGG